MKFKCVICKSPMKLARVSKDLTKIICSRTKCTYEIKKNTPEETVKYFKDNGGKCE